MDSPLGLYLFGCRVWVGPSASIAFGCERVLNGTRLVWKGISVGRVKSMSRPSVAYDWSERSARRGSGLRHYIFIRVGLKASVHLDLRMLDVGPVSK
jgi:hypothetical protein